MKYSRKRGGAGDAACTLNALTIPFTIILFLLLLSCSRVSHFSGYPGTLIVRDRTPDGQPVQCDSIQTGTYVYCDGTLFEPSQVMSIIPSP